MHKIPRGFVLRTLTPADLPAAQALLDACETADAGEPCVHEIELAVESRSPLFDFEHGAWVVVAEDGRLGGVGWLFRPGREGFAAADHYVRPDLRHEALDEVFLDLMEQRAGELARERGREGQGGRPLPLITYCEPLLASRRDSLLARGFTVVREIFMMRIDFADPLQLRASPQTSASVRRGSARTSRSCTPPPRTRSASTTGIGPRPSRTGLPAACASTAPTPISGSSHGTAAR